MFSIYSSFSLFLFRVVISSYTRGTNYGFDFNEKANYSLAKYEFQF